MPIDRKYGKVILEKQPTSMLDDEPVIVFRARDILAPLAVQAYAQAVAATKRGLGDSLDSVDDQVDYILQTAREMVSWREARGGGKLPD